METLESELLNINIRISLGIASPVDVKRRDQIKRDLQPKFSCIFETVQTAKCKK